MNIVQRFLFLSAIAVMVLFKVASAGSVNVNLNVDSCNLNTICEPMIGENSTGCSADCPPPPPVVTPTTTPSVVGGGGPTGGGNILPPVPFVITATSTSNINITPPQNYTPERITATSTITNVFTEMVRVEAFENYAVVTFVTKLPSLVALSWGNFGKYEIGSLAESWYHNKFNIKLENLVPSKRYYYSLSLKDTLGKTLYFEGDFFTADLVDRIAPPPPAEFRYALAKDSVFLRWINPTEPDLSVVRVVRSDIRYAKDPFSGKVVYEGAGQYAADTDVKEGVTYFYSIFSSDVSKNFSSPAVLQVKYIGQKDRATSTVITNKDWLLVDENPYVFMANSDGPMFTGDNNPKPNVCSDSSVDSSLDVSNIQFSQNNRTVENDGLNIIAETMSPITINLASSNNSKLDGQTLVLCINGTMFNEKFGYLFKDDSTERKFNLVIPAFTSEGDYKFNLKMLKSDSLGVTVAKGIFSIKSLRDNDNTGDNSFVTKVKNTLPTVVKIGVVIFLIWLLLMLARFIFI